jgi:hypothetical protein
MFLCISPYILQILLTQNDELPYLKKGRVRRTEPHAFATGAFSDVFKGVMDPGTPHEKKVRDLAHQKFLIDYL